MQRLNKRLPVIPVIKKITLLLSVLVLSGCSSIGIISVVTGASLYLGYQHSKAGGLEYRFRNFFLESSIERLWKSSELDEPFLKIVAVKNIPVIVGAATSAEGVEKAKAIAFAKSDNVQCLANTTIGKWNKDLACSVRGKLIFDLNISARNYEILAIKKHVWIVGVAQSELEKKYVLTKMEMMSGVESFSHYIVVSSDALDSGYVELEN